MEVNVRFLCKKGDDLRAERAVAMAQVLQVCLATDWDLENASRDAVPFEASHDLAFVDQKVEGCLDLDRTFRRDPGDFI